MTIKKAERDKEIDELADWCELVTHFTFGDGDPEILDLAQSGTRKQESEGICAGFAWSIEI